ncbi:hypothetical protein EVAR_7020_1 [Eumeta japonica]|uniref:Integrase catalytic domain-containing protein n=1 Tax=Eumeta variegata TaxID=151549 RepID=A0A4C1TJV4_EUMVA|nr:hypothetical protein EVAR_7020_1 [Eumeta japonica]
MNRLNSHGEARHPSLTPLRRLNQASRHTTTAYHPASNGLVERLHRQLKAAIIAHDSHQWVETLPLVLLGIRSAWRENLQISTAELVYGEPLHLPGQFFTSTRDANLDVTDFASLLQDQMIKLSPQPTFWRPTKKPLQAACLGPYKVLKRTAKTFDVQMQDKTVTVTLDRVKPACMADLEPTTTIPMAKTTVVRSQITIARSHGLGRGVL